MAMYPKAPKFWKVTQICCNFRILQKCIMQYDQFCPYYKGLFFQPILGLMQCLIFPIAIGCLCASRP